MYVLVSTIQVNSLALLYNFDWNQMASDALKLEESGTTMGISYINFKCVTGLSSIFHIVINLMYSPNPEDSHNLIKHPYDRIAPIFICSIDNPHNPNNIQIGAGTDVYYYQMMMLALAPVASAVTLSFLMFLFTLAVCILSLYQYIYSTSICP